MRYTTAPSRGCPWWHWPAWSLLLGAESLGSGLSWSPYYKIHVRDQAAGISISVNGIPHQTIRDVSKRRWLGGLRSVPYARTTDNRLRHVLIVGAGNGNDVAVALAQGAQSVDAVEIDPGIAEIGRRRHPNRPYQDPRVHLVVDDGRAFLQRTSTQLRPRAVRAAGLPHAGVGQQLAAAGELPVHARGGRRGAPVASGQGRRRSRCTTATAGHG